jgi:hypothetical protein
LYLTRQLSHPPQVVADLDQHEEAGYAFNLPIHEPTNSFDRLAPSEHLLNPLSFLPMTDSFCSGGGNDNVGDSLWLTDHSNVTRLDPRYMSANSSCHRLLQAGIDHPIIVSN